MDTFERDLSKDLRRGIAGQPGSVVDAEWLDPLRLTGPEWQYRNAAGEASGIVLGYRNGRGVGIDDNRHILTVTDKRARFVGLDAYTAAGGTILRDLFEGDQGGWMQDTGLLDKLVAEQLRERAEAIRAEGWKWIEVAPEFAYGQIFSSSESHWNHTHVDKSSLRHLRPARLS